MNTIILATLISLTFPSAPTNVVIPEASITLPLGVSLAETQSVSFSLELVPNATNNLEIALGFDANADGVLDLDECGRLFGYDCGKWYEKDGRTGEVTTHLSTDESDGEPIRREWIFRRRDMNFAWNALRLTRRGRGELDESATVDTKHVSFVFILK